MTMLTFALCFAALWVIQMILNWRQAKQFIAATNALRDLGDVVTGRYRKRGLRTYAALAIKDDRVTGSRILKGFTVFAQPKANDALLDAHIDELISLNVDGLDPRTAAAAAHAATLYEQHRREILQAISPR